MRDSERFRTIKAPPMRRFLCSGVVFVAVFWLLPSSEEASPVYSRRTNKECTFCHPPTNYNLTEAGKYYQEHKTLNGYQPKDEKKADPKKDPAKKPDPGGKGVQ